MHEVMRRTKLHIWSHMSVMVKASEKGRILSLQLLGQRGKSLHLSTAES